jgi:3-deoxy-D-manno-octulosonic-acid transferase
LPAISEILKEQRLRLILAPHEPHPDHLKQIEDRLQQAHIPSTRYSRATTWETPVLIIDQVGYLAEAYCHANIAFVGGSFRKKVHSVMEPLAAGLPVIVGPYHQNNREALQFQNISTNFLPGMVSCAEDIPSFQQTLSKILNSIELDPNIKNIIKNEVSKKSGATKNVLNWIESYLNKDQI